MSASASLRHGLVFAAGGLGAVLAIQLVLAAIAVLASDALPDGPGAAQSAGASKPAANLAELSNRILARPLFDPARRAAPETPAAAPPAPAANAAPPRLFGILVTGKERYAWFAEDDEDKPVRVAEGDDVDDWTVERISETSVVLSDGKNVEHEIVPTGASAGSGQAGPQQAKAPDAKQGDKDDEDDDDKDDEDDDKPASPQKK
jgi:hypothetical protein